MVRFPLAMETSDMTVTEAEVAPQVRMKVAGVLRAAGVAAVAVVACGALAAVAARVTPQNQASSAVELESYTMDLGKTLAVGYPSSSDLATAMAHCNERYRTYYTANTGCSNWADLRLQTVQTYSADACATQCAQTPRCTAINYQGTPNELCKGEGLAQYTCYLYSGTCDEEENSCWTLGVVSRKGPVQSPITYKEEVGCSNWKSIQFDLSAQLTRMECAQRCAATAACVAMNFQGLPNEDCTPAGQGVRQNACYLFNDSCQEETNGCWALGFYDDNINHIPYTKRIDWTQSGAPQFGNTYYPSMSLPNVTGAESLFDAASMWPWNATSFEEYVISWQMAKNERSKRFGALVMASFVSQPSAYDFFEDAQQAGIDVVNVGQPHPVSFLQGAQNVWDTDRFTAEFIGHTFIATFLEDPLKDQRQFVLDLSGKLPDKATPLQALKNRAASLAPPNLLRARGYLEGTESGPVLKRVEILDDSGTWLIFGPSDAKERWSLAKQALVSLAIFVIQCFHTGIHLFSGTTIMAMQNSMPTTTHIHGMTSPLALAVSYHIVQQAALLHSDHNSAFSGAIYDADIHKIQALTEDIAHFFSSGNPIDFLNMDSPRPFWWAGGSAQFEKPISEFANQVAAALFLEENTRAVLVELDEQLKIIGYPATDVTTITGFAKLFRNMLFVQGICHTHMFSQRESLTPLAGWPSTEGMLQVLKGQASIYEPASSPQMLQGFILSMATAGGFDPGIPELGDGPWPNHEDVLALVKAVDEFRAGMDETRLSVMDIFGSERGEGGFVPSYFFPKNVTNKPFGFHLGQTTYT